MPPVIVKGMAAMSLLPLASVEDNVAKRAMPLTIVKSIPAKVLLPLANGNRIAAKSVLCLTIVEYIPAKVLRLSVTVDSTAAIFLPHSKGLLYKNRVI